MQAAKTLIIEDNKTIATVQKHIAQKAGFDAEIATDLSEAIEAVSNNDYFCAIVDYNLPDAPDGEAIGFMLGANVPSIIMTGHMDNETRDKVLRLPVIDYIPKENRQAYEYLQTLLMSLRENHRHKVMVVDDSLAARKHLQILLERHNYKVLIADSAEMALQQLKRHPDIKLVITDQEMPGIDGIELTNQIRNDYLKDELAVIGVSSSNDSAMTARFIKSGANDFLRKPFNNEEFYCRVMLNIHYLEKVQTIQKQANSDYLTGLPNRRYFFKRAPQMMATGTVALAMFDIDHFKKINDQYGHDAGDYVLIEFAKLLKSHFGDQLLARFGGEEFAVLFKAPANSFSLLETFRTTLADHELQHSGQPIPCTVSIGLAFSCSDTIEQLIKSADECLYDAKHSGRNRIVQRRLTDAAS